MDELQKIKNTIVSKINPEIIYFLNMGPIYQFVIIWDKELSGFQKRTYVRSVLRFISSPFDVTVYSTEDYQKAIREREHMTMEVVNNGMLIYQNPTYYNGDLNNKVH